MCWDLWKFGSEHPQNYFGYPTKIYIQDIHKNIILIFIYFDFRVDLWLIQGKLKNVLGKCWVG